MAGQNLKFTVGQDSHTGLLRQENQDSFGWFSTPAGELFVVADGMGGAAGGRTAADMAIAALRQTFEQGGGSCADLLQQGMISGNSQVMTRAASEAELANMGSTVVALACKDGLAYIAHVGDSRIYLLRQGRLTRLSRDHSKVQKLIDSGEMTEAEAEQHPDAHIITRCIGGGKTIEPEVRPTPVACQAGDCFLLCTDGLSSLVSDQEMEKIIAGSSASPTDICQQLVKLALERGGHDNVTLQLICFSGQAVKTVLAPPKPQAPPPPASPVQPVAVNKPPIARDKQPAQVLSRSQLFMTAGLLLLLLMLATWWFVLKPTPKGPVVSSKPEAEQPQQVPAMQDLSPAPAFKKNIEGEGGALPVPSSPAESGPDTEDIKVQEPAIPPIIEPKEQKVKPQQPAKGESTYE